MTRIDKEKIAAAILRTTYELIIRRPEGLYQGKLRGAVVRRTLITTDQPNVIKAHWEAAGYEVSITPVSELKGIE